jgi:tRNA threonylcarbamoyladenosine modification (KEOPS) complex Cgi121 subunit
MIEIFSLEPLFDNSNVSVQLFHDVTNAKEVLQQVRTGSLNACFVDADSVCDKVQILVAASRAVSNARAGAMKTHSLNSELLYFLGCVQNVRRAWRCC